MFPSLRRWIARHSVAGLAPRARSRRLGRPETLERRLMMDGAWAEAFAWDIDWNVWETLNAVPALESLPTAEHTLYLDFNGHFEPTWASDGFTFANIQTAAFDMNGDLDWFSPEEQATMERIWRIVAEDFAPFNVNVTTVDPGGWENADGRLERVVFGGLQQDMPVAADSTRTQADWNNNGNSGYGNIDQYLDPDKPNVCYIFSAEMWRRANDGLRDDNGNLLSETFADVIANTASHEAGHAYGLWHQVDLDGLGNVTDHYTQGTPDWTPIMGDNYSSDRLTWWNGAVGAESVPETPWNDWRAVTQDQLTMLSNVLGYRADDHGDFVSGATVLGQLPVASSLSTRGVIGAMWDVDYFSFQTGGGLVNVDLLLPDGANLDGKLELWSEGWNWWSQFPLAADDPSGELGASIEVNLAAGTYFIAVASHGRYGDLGQYTLRVTPDLSRFDEVDDSWWTDYSPIEPDPWYANWAVDPYEAVLIDPYVYEDAYSFDEYAYDYFADDYRYLDEVFAYDESMEAWSDFSAAESYDSYGYDVYLAELIPEEAMLAGVVEEMEAPNATAAALDAVFGGGPTNWLADAAVTSWGSYSYYSIPSSLYVASYSLWF